MGLDGNNFSNIWKKYNFLKKKLGKVLQVRRKCVPLHPQSREMALKHAEIAQLVEHNLAKVGVAGPSPVFRSHLEQKEALEIGFNVKMPRWRNW